jgi:ketosteroid isomerase-like protein
MRKLLAVAVLGCLPWPLNAQTASEKAVPVDRVVAELSVLRYELSKAAVARDIESYLAFWAPDARVREPGLRLNGTEFVIFAKDFFAKGQVILLNIRPSNVYVHGDVAYEFGEYDEKATVDGQMISVENNYAMRWRQMPNGSWRIDQFIAGARDN